MVAQLILIIILLILAVLGVWAVAFFRDVFRWRRILNQQLRSLGREKATAAPGRVQAIEMVENTCRYLLGNSVDVSQVIEDIPDDMRQMAGMFHPDALKPELRVTPAHIIFCLDRSLPLLDELQKRPGFSTISGMSIRDLKMIYQRYKAWFQPNPEGIPPLSELLQLGKNIRLLVYARYLFAELYLFLGRLGMAVYGEDAPYLMEETNMDLEVILTELSKAREERGGSHNGEIEAIRNRLVGMPQVLMAEPDVKKWKTSVVKAAERIAAGYFPESPSPLLEARIGPLISRSRTFLGSLGKGDNVPMAGKMLKIRLETLFQTKSMSETLIPPQVRQIVMRTQKTYGWLKWPLNVYMMASKGMFWKIAVDLGWYAGRKAILVLIFGKSFDKAVHELEALYSQSSAGVRLND